MAAPLFLLRGLGHTLFFRGLIRSGGGLIKFSFLEFPPQRPMRLATRLRSLRHDSLHVKTDRQTASPTIRAAQHTRGRTKQPIPRDSFRKNSGATASAETDPTIRLTSARRLRQGSHAAGAAARAVARESRPLLPPSNRVLCSPLSLKRNTILNLKTR